MEPRREVNFDRVAHEYDTTRGGDERARGAARDLAENLPASTTTVLEMGVGTGIVAAALRVAAPQVGRLAGVDISEQMLRRAAERLPGGVVRASVERLPLPAEQFDAVVAVHVLHLVPDLVTTLAEARRVLRQGGRVVALHGPPEHERGDMAVALEPLTSLAPPRRDTPAAVLASAQEAGLRLVAQRPASAQVSHQSPAELADLLERRTWSHLWLLDDEQWARCAVPVISAVRALPDPERPRVHRTSNTLTVLERP